MLVSKVHKAQAINTTLALRKINYLATQANYLQEQQH
jgi:hypothetical protein